MKNNAEAAHSLGDHPAVGGAYGPELNAGFAQSLNHRRHILKDVTADKLLHITRGGGA